MKTPYTISRINGMTLIEVLVIIALVAVLVALFLPTLATPHHRPSRIYCVNNLKQIGMAYRVWQGDNNDAYPMGISTTNGGAMEFVEKGIAYPAFQVMSNELGVTKILICPADNLRSAATSFSTGFDNSHLSYFVGLVKNNTDPNLIISGDDNLEINGVRARTGILTPGTNASVAWTTERHNKSGNIGQADGSVLQVSRAGLISAISNAASSSRFVIP